MSWTILIVKNKILWTQDHPRTLIYEIKLIGKNSTCHEDSKDSLHRNNVFKCTYYIIDHRKCLTILQLRGLQLRGMVDPLGHLAILKLFLSQAEWGQHRVREDWGGCWTLMDSNPLAPSVTDACSEPPLQLRSWGTPTENLRNQS